MPGLSFNSCDGRLIPTRNRPEVVPYGGVAATERRRPVVMSFTGDGHFRDMLLPSALSLLDHASFPVDFHFLTDSSGVSDGNMEAFSKVAEFSGRDATCRFYDVPSAVDLECFSQNNSWGGLGTYFPQCCKAVLGVDEYVLYMDTDVLVTNNIIDLFLLCDSILSPSALICRTNTNRSLENPHKSAYDTPAFPVGGFLMFNPSSDSRNGVFRSLWSRCCHANDEYAAASASRDFEIVDISRVVWWVGDSDSSILDLSEPPYAVHIGSTGLFGKFDRSMFPYRIRPYVDMFKANQRIVGRVLS